MTNIRRLSASDTIAPSKSPGFVVFTRESGSLDVVFACSRNPWLLSDAVPQRLDVER